MSSSAAPCWAFCWSASSRPALRSGRSSSPELDPFRRAGLIEQALCRGMKGYFIGLLGLSDDRYRTAKRRAGNCAALFHKRNEGGDDSTTRRLRGRVRTGIIRPEKGRQTPARRQKICTNWIRLHSAAFWPSCAEKRG